MKSIFNWAQSTGSFCERTERQHKICKSLGAFKSQLQSIALHLMTSFLIWHTFVGVWLHLVPIRVPILLMLFLLCPKWRTWEFLLQQVSTLLTGPVLYWSGQLLQSSKSTCCFRVCCTITSVELTIPSKPLVSLDFTQAVLGSRRLGTG